MCMIEITSLHGWDFNHRPPESYYLVSKFNIWLQFVMKYLAIHSDYSLPWCGSMFKFNVMNAITEWDVPESNQVPCHCAPTALSVPHTVNNKRGLNKWMCKTHNAILIQSFFEIIKQRFANRCSITNFIMYLIPYVIYFISFKKMIVTHLDRKFLLVRNQKVHYFDHKSPSLDSI